MFNHNNHSGKLLNTALTLILFGVVSHTPVYGHGSIEVPISRAYNCFLENPESPDTDACREAFNVGGKQAGYDWDAIGNNANGQHRDVIPDGELCSAGNSKFKGFDLPRSDWLSTPIEADSQGNFDFVYHATAAHASEYFDFYITRDGYDPTQPLTWDALEATPFCRITDVTLRDERYRMRCPLPEGKKGKHLIYNVWQRGDSPEAFYACVDVTFQDDTPPPPPPPSDPITLSIMDTEASEADGEANAEIVLSQPATGTVTALVHSREADAKAGTDFWGFSRTIEFAQGDERKNVPIALLNDETTEDTETLVVRIATSTGAEIEKQQGVVTITDDDLPGRPLLSVSDVSVDESAGEARVEIKLSQPADVEVGIHTSGRSATGGGVDYFGFTRKIAFSNGELSKVVTIGILDDTLTESTEDFRLRLFDAKGAAIEDEIGTIEILDDD